MRCNAENTGTDFKGINDLVVVELKVVLVRVKGPGAEVRSESEVYATLILRIHVLCDKPEEAGTDYKGINNLVVVELKVVLVRIKGPGAKVEVAVLLAPGPVVIRHSLAQNLAMYPCNVHIRYR